MISAASELLRIIASAQRLLNDPGSHDFRFLVYRCVFAEFG